MKHPKCQGCSRRATTGKKRCRRCLKRARDYGRRLLAAGLCRCKHPLADDGYTRCPACREKVNRHRNVKYHARKAQGLCPSAGCHVPPAPGHVYCQFHLDQIAAALYVLRTRV